MPLHPVDYAAFSIFTSFSLALGLYYSICKKKDSTRCYDDKRNTSGRSGIQHEEVFLGGRSIPSWLLAISLLASVATGVGVVSHSAHQYAYGFHFAWNIAAMALATPCIVYFFLPVLYALKVTSVFEQILGAVSIYSAGSWNVNKVDFGVSCGADCVQGIVLFAAPLVIIGKILHDSAHLDVPLRPLSDLDTKQGFLRSPRYFPRIHQF
ncbi:hypothetical protein HPB49_006798 [Dermacentor silvarum]|uniref:Uncharacterized protein n=1 Tax=Dermacentor silvarum TaxID=543639 RepID=A0ACB8DMZ4_DERSI|nr:hypothetical protein HPB49_006798 [Dermacentor silvarum]